MAGRRRAATASLVLLLAAACPAAADTPPPRDLHLDVTLASGDRVPGSGADRQIVLFTNAGRVGIALSRVRAVDRNQDGETVTVRTADGVARRGVLETETLDVLPTGASAPRRIATADVRALRVTPRVRIAGSGDAWWDLAFANALGWQVENGEDRLSVRSIDPARVNPGSHGPWSRVLLSRDVAPFGDFRLAAGIAWDADGAGPRAMQGLYVSLLDAAGNEIASAGHHDAWDGTTGSRYSRLAGTVRESGHGTQPATGRADLRIVRSDGRLRVLFDGEEAQACESRAAVARIVVQVDFYAYCGPEGKSVFGTATLERVEIR